MNFGRFEDLFLATTLDNSLNLRLDFFKNQINRGALRELFAESSASRPVLRTSISG